MAARRTNAPGSSCSPAFEARVLTGDCRQKMRSLAAKTVSLILTDPPYFIDGMDDNWNSATLRKRFKKGGTVGGLPAGMKFSPNQGKRLCQFLSSVALEWRRIIKPGGFVLCFAQARLAHRATLALEEAGFEIRDLLAWKYEGQAKAFTQEHFIRRNSSLSANEKSYIIKELGGRKTPQLKPQMEMIILAQAPREGTFVANWLKYRTGLVDLSQPLIEPSRFPGTVLPTPKPRERYGHISPKPVLLLRHLIRIFCAEGADSLILDPFTGSGSTGEAAIIEKRSFLGFEIEPTMSRRATERLAKVAAARHLDGARKKSA